METVRRWCLEGEPRRHRLRPVEIVPEQSAGGLVVLSHSGLRIEGLTIADVAALLRALG